MEQLAVRPEVDQQKEPLQFALDLDDAGIADDIIIARNAIKQAAERSLYHWKTLPITLPNSITDDRQSTGDSYKPQFSFKDLFVAPTFNEVDQVAKDSKGNVRKLNRKQLSCIRRTGEFEVESMNFPGQVHKWRLNQLLQKGQYNAHESFLNDLALCLKMLIIYSKDRFVSPCLSLSESWKSLWLFLWHVLDILFGMARTKIHNLSLKLLEEHSRFLVAELITKSTCRQDWNSFCNYVKEKCNQLTFGKLEVNDFHPPNYPYIFLTPSKVEIDMRLFSRDLLNRSTAIVQKILDQESRGWYIKYKDQVITELKGQDMTHTEIKEYVHKSIQDKYHEKVFSAILSNEDLEKVQPGIGSLLVAQAKCALNIEKNLSDIKDKFRVAQQEHKVFLVQKYPLRSRIKQWVNRKLQEHGKRFIEQHAWDPHYQTIDDCRAQGLEQMMYFLYRDLIFMRDREPVLKKELSKVKIASRDFAFTKYIWLPTNWIVKKHLQNEVRVVPTVISKTYFLSGANQHTTTSTDPSFTLEKTKKYKTSTSYFFWRVLNYFYRSFLWTLNAIFWLGIVVPWFSPVSLRTLLSVRPFMSNYMLNPLNGEVCPDPSSKRNTLFSRLRKLWSHVRESRHKFECEPETGFLGKSLTRHFNRLWNYVVKGFFGSVLMTVFLVPLCLCCSLSCLALAFLAPIWVPVTVLAMHLFAVLIYDFDHSDDSNRWFYLMETIILKFLVHGCMQPVSALLLAFVIIPVAAWVVFIGGILRRSFRSLWDTVMFHCIIKKRGRIPSRDGFVVRRIAGPGLASNYYYQIRPEQALAAMEACMEVHELDAWSRNYSTIIEQPKRDYKKFVDSCFGPFSGGLLECGVYQKLVLETKDYQTKLLKQVESQKQKLNLGLSVDTQSRIRLTSRELKVVIAQTSKMLEEFYPGRVLSRLHKPEEKFWEDRHLDFRDWQGLSTQLLTEVFSTSFITPLEEIDTCFKLNVEHLNLKRYLEMLKSAEFRDDLDVVSTVHTPKGDIDVDPPFMSYKLFNPIHDSPMTHVHDRKQTNSRKEKDMHNIPELWSSFEKLSLPLPIAHPSTVAVIIHNRDENRQQINLEDEIFQLILNAAESLPFLPSVAVTSTNEDNNEGSGSSPERSSSENVQPDTNSSLQVVVPIVDVDVFPDQLISDDGIGTIKAPESSNFRINLNDDELHHSGGTSTINLTGDEEMQVEQGQQTSMDDTHNTLNEEHITVTRML